MLVRGSSLLQRCHFGNENAFWEAAHDGTEALFLAMHLEHLLEDELGRTDDVDADRDGYGQCQNAEHDQVWESQLILLVIVKQEVQLDRYADYQQSHKRHCLIERLKGEHC